MAPKRVEPSVQVFGLRVGFHFLCFSLSFPFFYFDFFFPFPCSVGGGVRPKPNIGTFPKVLVPFSFRFRPRFCSFFFPFLHGLGSWDVSSYLVPLMFFFSFPSSLICCRGRDQNKIQTLNLKVSGPDLVPVLVPLTLCFALCSFRF